jgi:hypothetical protein
MHNNVVAMVNLGAAVRIVSMFTDLFYLYVAICDIRFRFNVTEVLYSKNLKNSIIH